MVETPPPRPAADPGAARPRVATPDPLLLLQYQALPSRDAGTTKLVSGFVLLVVSPVAIGSGVKVLFERSIPGGSVLISFGALSFFVSVGMMSRGSSMLSRRRMLERQLAPFGLVAERGNRTLELSFDVALGPQLVMPQMALRF